MLVLRIGTVLAGFACQVSAQAGSGQTNRVAIRGTVRDSVGAPIANAQVLLLDDTVQARTSNAGIVALVGMQKRGLGTVLVRRLGYAPAEQAITIPDSGLVQLSFMLRRNVQSLVRVEVKAQPHIIGGVVHDENGKPIFGAEIAMLGGGQRQDSDSGGRIDLPIKHSHV